MEKRELIERILDIAYDNNLSHLGSYFSSVGIIDDIFQSKDEEDIFILSAGHCALALYVVLEKYLGHDAARLFDKHGGHPHRCEEDDANINEECLPNILCNACQCRFDHNKFLP